MSRIILFYIALSFINNSLIGQTFEWAKSFGGDFRNIGYSIDTDNKGNVYTTGFFEGTADFDPGPGVYNLSSNGNNDIFILKLDKGGNFVWAKSFGGLSSNVPNPIADTGYGIVTDKDGNVYVCGAFEKTVDFNPGLGIYNISSSGAEDIFILKLDTDGNFIWVKNIGGNWQDVARSIAIKNGNLYITGDFSGTVDFDPGPGVYNLGAAIGGTFILKLDIDGNFIWAKSLEGRIDGKSIAIDNNGNVLTTGNFSRTIDFDPGSGIYNLSSVINGGFSTWDIFISKLDSNGNFIWAKSFEGTGFSDEGASITTDKSGNIYTTGSFGGLNDFNPGSGVYNLSSTGYKDIFISKLDKDGNFVWARKMGGQNADLGFSIGVDKYENVYSTGHFSNDADFDPGPGIYNMSGPLWSSGSALFISKLNANGNFMWAHSIGDQLGSSTQGFSIYIDLYQNIYLTGYFSDIADFDIGPDTFELIVHDDGPGYDAFILKLSQCPTTIDTIHINTCDSYTWIDGNTYTLSTDTAQYILPNAEGCDSIVSLELTINHSDSTLYQYTECNSLIWKGD
ncbi:MAG: hypothetical protein DSY82_06760, partial [Flavobacteriia bacterium]